MTFSCDSRNGEAPNDCVHPRSGGHSMLNAVARLCAAWWSTAWGFAFGRAIEAQKLNLLLKFN